MLRTDRVRRLLGAVRELDEDEVEDLRAALAAYYPGRIDAWEERSSTQVDLCALLAGVDTSDEAGSSLRETALECGSLLRLGQ